MKEKEIESIREIEKLKQQLAEVIETGAQNGDLSQAWVLRHQIEEKMVEISLPYLWYEVEVDYESTIEELLTSDNFKVMSKIISEQNFSDREGEKVKRTIYIVPIKEYTSTSEVISAMRQRGLEPASLKELLCLASQYLPEDAIVALGSHGVEGQVVAFDNSLGGRRILMFSERLGAISAVEKWHPSWSFAAVRI